MKLHKPMVQLFRKRVVRAPHQYTLHAVTFFNQTNVIANGHRIIPDLDKDGCLQVILKVQETPRIPHHNALTPVTHTIRIGETPFGNRDGIIKVIVQFQDRNTEKSGESHASTSNSEEDDRPIKDR